MSESHDVGLVRPRPPSNLFVSTKNSSQALSPSRHYTLPSPPLSDSSDAAAGALDFDLEPLDHIVARHTTPPGSEHDHFVASPQSSTALVSPKLSTLTGLSPTSFKFDGLDVSAAAATVGLTSNTATSPTTTAEALSVHHLERFLHYKALAAQAQAELSLSLLESRQPMGTEDVLKNARNAMLSLQTHQPAPFFSAPAPTAAAGWNQTFTYQQQQHHQQQQHVFHAQAQAQSHLQAHEAAAQQAAAAQRNAMTNYYMPQRTSFDGSAPGVPQAPSLWSRQSASTSVSGASPPFPSTPTYTASATLADAKHPSFATTGPSLPAIDGENEIEADELEFGSPEADDSHSNVSIPNLHGGGRGYVPGKTPDDPKKRHKCTVCGRGFARVFNLKSHVQTHDPLRPKPHQCPHHMCKRSFSRLHDLERHRQGIHSDGPLVDAKRQGVSPSVVRAQSRMQRRAEAGGLI